MATNSPQELEAIFVRLYAETSGYTSGMQGAMGLATSLRKEFEGIVGAATAAGGAIDRLTVSLTALNKASFGGAAGSVQAAVAQVMRTAQTAQSVQGSAASVIQAMGRVSLPMAAASIPLRIVPRPAGFPTLSNLSSPNPNWNNNPTMSWAAQQAQQAANAAAAARVPIFTYPRGGLGSLSTQVTQTAKATADAAVDLEEEVKKVTKKTTQAVGSIRVWMLLARAAIAGVGVAAYASFDDTLTRVLGRMGDFQQTQRGGIQAGIMSEFSNSPFSSTDLLKGLGDVGASGMEAATALQALHIAEKFALASGMDLAEATKYLVDIQLGLGRSGQDAASAMADMTHIADVLIGSSTLARVSTHEMAEAFSGRLAGAMRDVNMSLEQGSAALIAYHLNLIRGRDAGFRLSLLLESLKSHSIEHMQLYRNLGINVFQQGTGELKPLYEIISQIEKRVGGVSVQFREAALMAMGFSHQTARSILPLLGMSETMKQIEESAKAFGGMNEMMAELVRHDFANQLRITWKLFGDMAILIGESLAPALAVLNDALQSMVRWFNQLDPTVRTFLVYLFMIPLALVPIVALLTIIGGPLLAGLTAGFSALGAIIGFVFTPLGATLIGIVGLLYALGVSWEDVTEALTAGIVWVVGVLYNWRENLSIIYNWFKTNWKTMATDIFEFTKRLFDGILLNLIPTLEMISRLSLAAFMFIRTEMLEALFDPAEWAKAFGNALLKVLEIGAIYAVKLAQLLTNPVAFARDWFAGRRDLQDQVAGALGRAGGDVEAGSLGATLTRIFRTNPPEFVNPFAAGPGREAFSFRTPGLALATGLPDTITNALLSGMRNLRGIGETGEQEPFAIPGHEHTPHFKQISLAREMIGGTAAELLDREQKVSAPGVENRLSNIREAIGQGNNDLSRIADLLQKLAVTGQ